MGQRYNSRLEKHLETQTKKYIVYTIIGIIIVIVIIVKFGIPIILGTSTLFSKNNQTDQSSQQENQVSFINPPILNSLPNATKDDTITVSGTAQKGYEIQLYDNNQVVDKISADNNGSFSFNDESLKDGTNNFTAKAINGSKQSDFSNQVSTDYHKNPPSLSIDSPSDNATFSHDQNPITVSGKTDPNVTVTVNGYQATIDENGKYTYVLNLQNGGGMDIKVEATDDAVNKTDKQVHITYNP